jgi:hypothetical protein
MTSFFVAVVSGIVMLWSLFQLIRHISTEARMGAAIYIVDFAALRRCGNSIVLCSASRS